MAEVSTVDDAKLAEDIEAAHDVIDKVLSEIAKELIGQEKLRRRLLTALLANGHALLEGVPGLAKTLSIKALAQAIDASFQRIQFTPDLLPADVIGTEIYRQQHGDFEVRKGPVFAHFVLADEINRAPAKVQSALLEIMQERQVTIGNQSLAVPMPFFVLATQNPIEQEGTYPLPEAQTDRFLMKVKVDYPSPSEEREMLDVVTSPSDVRRHAQSVCSLEDVCRIQKLCEEIYVDERLREYIIKIVWATRKPADYGLEIDTLVELGASPRAAIALLVTARAEALLCQERYVVPQMIKDLAADVLRHRILLTYEAEAQGLCTDDIVQMVLDGVEVP